MKRILLVGMMAALVTGCRTGAGTSASGSGIPRMKSHLTAREADQVMCKGMSRAEVNNVIGSVPIASGWSTSFALADGWVRCQWKDGALENWSTTTRESKEEPERMGREGRK